MSSEVKVGAFTLGGAAVLAGIITFMGAFTFGKNGYELQIAYPQVSGLMPGHVVRYAGVQVGTVKQINVAPDKVEVTAEIDDNIKIPQGATFSIGADGILGEKFVNVIPPKQMGLGYIAEGSAVRGVPGGGMEEFFASSGEMMNDFKSVFGDKQVQQDMRDCMHNMSLLTERMNTIAGHMESMMKGVDNNGATGQNIAAIVETMAATTARLDSMVAVLEGVATDPVTAETLKATIANAKEASSRANKILGTVSEAKMQADIGNSMGDGHDWRGSLGVKFAPGDAGYLYLGAYDLGDTNKLDLYAGKKIGNASFSMGAMQGEFGVGASYDFSKKFRMYSQLYDFDNTKVRLGGELRVNNNFSVYGESMDLKGTSEDTYVGVRSYF